MLETGTLRETIPLMLRVNGVPGTLVKGGSESGE